MTRPTHDFTIAEARAAIAAAEIRRETKRPQPAPPAWALDAATKIWSPIELQAKGGTEEEDIWLKKTRESIIQHHALIIAAASPVDNLVEAASAALELLDKQREEHNAMTLGVADRIQEQADEGPIAKKLRAALALAKGATP